MYKLHKLLWDIRKNPDRARAFRKNPYSVLQAYGIEGETRDALVELDFKKLHEIGANPYLIYFCAIQLQVDRTEYYEQIRKEEN